ncbi:MAG TPA: nuclear transport factor 2 family protein [Acidobacteriota bacterium]|nr:nuclear transport factor 2 family protein [Acidobacteriota bacterium]
MVEYESRAQRDAVAAVRELVDRETRAWDTQDVELLMSILHPDMVWPWPPHDQAHDPLDWVIDWGRYSDERWRRGWQDLFDSHELVHNHRETLRVVVSDEADGGLAVVDVDTLWRDASGHDFHWRGRAAKIYTKDGQDWKLIAHTGLLEYPPRPR